MTFSFYGFLFILATEYVGLAHYIPIIKPLHLTLLLSVLIFFYVISKNPLSNIFKHRQTKIIAIFLGFTFLSIFYAIVKTHVFNVFKAQAGYFLLFVSAYFLLKDVRKIKIYMLSMLFLHLILFFVNLDKLTASVRAGGLKAGYFLGDGNDFAWSFVIVLPFSLYFLIKAQGFIKKIFFAVISFIMLFAVILTSSRGATLSVIASFIYLVMLSKKKAAYLFLIVILAGLVTVMAPGSYLERIHSIKDYKEDSSAKGRFIAWKAATNMAVDYPLGVGAGNFSSAYGRFYRDKYVDNSMWASGRWISAHSIYFLVLGEYGFIGLFLLLYQLFLNFRDNTISKNKVAAMSEKGAPADSLPIFINMSLVGYSVGGVFLGGINYPHLLLLTALTLRVNELLFSRDNPVSGLSHNL